MLSEQIIDFLKQYVSNDYLLLFLISAIPLVEMRGAVLLATKTGGAILLKSLVCWLGSSAVCLPIVLCFRPIVECFKKTKAFGGLAVKVESLLGSKAKRKLKVDLHGQNSQNRKYLALFVFVAIPLPLTGVWSGSAISCFMKGTNFKKVVSVVGGNLVATALMTVMARLSGRYADLLLCALLLVVAFCVLLTAYKLLRTKPND